MAELTVEYIAISKLKPYERNAREHKAADIAAIKASIEEFGFNDPVGIWSNENVIVEGHGRVMAAKQLGMESVPCIRLDSLTDEQRRAYALAHNRTAELSGWDFVLRDAELKDIMEIDMTAFGFEEPEDPADNEAEEDEAPLPGDVETRAKPGDLWKLGRHLVKCGDSTDINAVDDLMSGEQADLLLTDPPYNCAVEKCDRPNSSHNGVGILNDNMAIDDFIPFLTSALWNAKEKMKPGAAFYIWYAGLHHIEFETAVKNVPEFKLGEQLVWVKSHFVLGRSSDYQWMHELCLYGWKEGAAHYFTNSRCEATVIEDAAVKLSTLKKGELIELCEKLMGASEATTILRADKPNSADLHPTVKPQYLLAQLIKNSSKRGGIVLDLFGGSGSTLIACEQLDRTCRMCELDPKYVDVILERWERMTGEKAVLIGQEAMEEEDQKSM